MPPSYGLPTGPEKGKIFIFTNTQGDLTTIFGLFTIDPFIDFFEQFLDFYGTTIPP